MDADSLAQVRSLWVDVAEPFARVVPDGCVLARALDDWRPGLRVRGLEMRRGADCPPIAELLEEAREDAQRRGWTALEEADAFELEGVILRFSGGPVLSIRFEQPWPVDAGAPVETSEAFQNMVRKVLGMGGAPSRLLKEVTVDRADLARIDSLRERVVLPPNPRLLQLFPRLGYSFDIELDAWVSRGSLGEFDLYSRVKETFDAVDIELTKTRRAV